jgi:hypothetical protein
MKRVVAPEFPKRLSVESVRAYKSALRRYDRARVAAGEATAEQIQQENSAVRRSKTAAILNFPELEKCR